MIKKHDLGLPHLQTKPYVYIYMYVCIDFTQRSNTHTHPTHPLHTLYTLSTHSLHVYTLSTHTFAQNRSDPEIDKNWI